MVSPAKQVGPPESLRGRLCTGTTERERCAPDASISSCQGLRWWRDSLFESTDLTEWNLSVIVPQLDAGEYKVPAGYDHGGGALQRFRKNILSARMSSPVAGSEAFREGVGLGDER